MESSVFVDPGLTSTVEQPQILRPVDPKQPERKARVPVVLIAVEDDRAGVVLALAVLSQVQAYWMVGKAVALTVVEIAGGVAWLMWLMADREQNPQPSQEAVKRLSPKSRLTHSLLVPAPRPNPA